MSRAQRQPSPRIARNSSRWRKVGLIAVLLLVLAGGATYYASQTYTIDEYDGQPQVVGLPQGYDPRAPTAPYDGRHPSRRGRAVDPHAYPIPIGTAGPVQPTYGLPLQYPFACRTETSGLGQPLVDNQNGAGVAVYAVDAGGSKSDRVIGYSKDCSIATRVYYFYRPRGDGPFVPLPAGDNGAPPDAATVTLNGVEVPFVVRVEMGTINRHIYVIAMMRGPDDTPARPDTRHWNRALLYEMRGGVGIGYRQGRIEPGYLPSRRRDELARGYAVAHSTANQTSTHYDIQLAEDTLARVKRQFVGRYAEPRETIAIGKSGGAIQQYLIGQNRPGLLDAGIAMYSYPDMITQTIKVMDCELLEYFFDVTDADNPKWRDWSQRRWVLGMNALDDLPNPFERLRALQSVRLGEWPDVERGQTECTRSWRNLTPQIANPHYTYFASLFAPAVYTQVPWTYWDGMKHVYGTDQQGYGRRTWDNVGVQYGLAALTDGRLTGDEFFRLNASVGSWKPAADMNPERFWLFAGGRSDLAELSVWSEHNMRHERAGDRPAPRSAGDVEAIAAAYRSGHVFIGALNMPIIDLRHYLEPQLDMHHALESFSARLRMQRHQGRADNQLVWMVEPPAAPLADALDVLHRWLEQRRRARTAFAGDSRPEDADDRCYASDGGIVARGEGVWNGVWNGREDGPCMRRFPIFSNSRIVAGDDYAGEIFKCYLQSVDEAIARGVYAPLDATTLRERLLRVFPDGVCDYSRGDAARPADLLSR